MGDMAEDSLKSSSRTTVGIPGQRSHRHTISNLGRFRSDWVTCQSFDPVQSFSRETDTSILPLPNSFRVGSLGHESSCYNNGKQNKTLITSIPATVTRLCVFVLLVAESIGVSVPRERTEAVAFSAKQRSVVQCIPHLELSLCYFVRWARTSASPWRIIDPSSGCSGHKNWGGGYDLTSSNPLIARGASQYRTKNHSTSRKKIASPLYLPGPILHTLCGLVITAGLCTQ